ncbi:SAF domain-containing protein [Nocardia otitidiscaviarum]|uniref:SAF domain-containing protein n=1 Tax=Nocardia otitidiscaviarum TaxID=1823 RepID=UPI0004A7498A|nr:SAF domain-containing protein [Nocardia otitidiscaviarum]MBF6131488.1 SAF domain-containing protein [Nocardia otitidiscaviarum]MBF6482634.1 SAF domain-containing protein [Nocardia otitidiscaviarum]
MNRLRSALAELPRPPWSDGVVPRRLVAVGLLATAAVLALRGDPDDRRTDVVVAARELPPGHTLDPSDVRTVGRETAGLPEGFAGDPAAVLGATLTGAVRAGEILTDVRVVGPRLAAAAAGTPDARIVPIRLADDAVASVLRAGDRVDVVAAAPAEADPAEATWEERSRRTAGADATRPVRVLATDAAVILVSGADEPRDAGDRVVLVALDARHAAAVAAASLQTALTVVFH